MPMRRHRLNERDRAEHQLAVVAAGAERTARMHERRAREFAGLAIEAPTVERRAALNSGAIEAVAWANALRSEHGLEAVA